MWCIWSHLNQRPHRSSGVRVLPVANSGANLPASASSTKQQRNGPETISPEEEESFLKTLLAEDFDDNDVQDAPNSLASDRATLSYLNHVVLPEDTFYGICLRYRVSATELRRANCFSGSNLALAPAVMRIPVRQQQQQVAPQDTNSAAYKVQSLLVQFPAFQNSEARTILESHGWDLEAAVQFLLGHCRPVGYDD